MQPAWAQGEMQFITTHVIRYCFPYGAACWGRSANMSYFVFRHQRSDIYELIWIVCVRVLGLMCYSAYCLRCECINEFIFNSNEVNGGITTMEWKLIMANGTKAAQKCGSVARIRSLIAFEYIHTNLCTWRTLFTYASDSHFFEHITCVTGIGLLLVWLICLRLRRCIHICISIQLIIQFHQLPVKLVRISHRLILIANCCKQWTGWVRTIISLRFFYLALSLFTLTHFL